MAAAPAQDHCAYRVQESPYRLREVGPPAFAVDPGALGLFGRNDLLLGSGLAFWEKIVTN